MNVRRLVYKCLASVFLLGTIAEFRATGMTDLVKTELFVVVALVVVAYMDD